MQRCALLINPAAGSGRFQKIKKQLFQALRDNQLPIEIFTSESPENYLRLASELAKNFDLLLIAGGDSALTLAVNSIENNFPIMGFIPIGTCNDISRHYYSFSLESYLQKVKKRTFKLLPIAKISTNQISRLFIGQCSCGAGQLLNQELEEQKNKANLWKRLPPFIGGVLLFKKIQHKLDQYYFLQTDQNSMEGKFSLVVISLIDYFSCGLRIFKSSSSSQLRLLALKNNRLRFFIKTYFQLKRDPDFCSSQILRLQELTKITLRSTKPFSLQYDGELFSHHSFSEYNIEVVPQKLPLIC